MKKILSVIVVVVVTLTQTAGNRQAGSKCTGLRALLC